MKTKTGGVPAGLVLVALLGGCGGEPEGHSAAGTDGVTTGLYESGSGPRRNQLCLIGREGRSAAFGFIVWGEGNRNCSARGIARRDGDRLRLLPDGDESCAFEARLEGDRIIFPGAVAPECVRYYCGDGVTMTEAAFTRAGTAEGDAQQATDLAGVPLCAG